MIRVSGEANGSHDPKLTTPLVASAGAHAAAERTVSARDVSELRNKAVAVLTARIGEPDAFDGRLLDARIEAVVQALSAAVARIEALEVRVTAFEAKPVTVTAFVTELVPALVTRGNAGNGNAAKLTAAEKQRAYRARQKSKTK